MAVGTGERSGMTIRRLQHVSSPYPSGRQAQVREFYGDLLGLVEIGPPDTLAHRELVWFAAGPGDLELHFFPDIVDPGHARHLCLEVTDLEALRRRLEERGYAALAATPIPNRPRFMCRDPFGNLVEFTTINGPYGTET
jgi:catechol 2,3-dioxygenase-like lactoylglutathione lyase family enzyme